MSQKFGEKKSPSAPNYIPLHWSQCTGHASRRGKVLLGIKIHPIMATNAIEPGRTRRCPLPPVVSRSQGGAYASVKF